MKFRLWSDVHNEFGDIQFHPSPTDSENILIIAGDWATPTNPRVDLMNFFCQQFQHVIFVAGNHDYWGSSIAEEDKLWKCFEAGHENFHYLNPGFVIIGDVIVVGATLWTDCCKGDPVKLEFIRRYMTDFQFIKEFKTNQNAWIDLHVQHREFIKNAICSGQGYKILIVTHHIPHSVCDPENPFNPGFACTDMDDLIDPDLISAWVFGHTHVPVNFELNRVKMLSNPRGYKGCEELATKWDAEELDKTLFEI